MPSPITDPLRSKTGEDITDVDLSDPQHEEISKGMAARNYKMWLIAAGAIGVAAMLAWPTKHNIPKAPSPNTTSSQGDQQPGDKFVKALIQDANAQNDNKRSEITHAPAVPIYTGPSNGTAAGALFGKTPDGTDKMTPEEAREARRQSIIASPTEATDVKLSQHQGNVGVPGNADDETLIAQAKKLSKEQQALMGAINSGVFNQNGKAGVPPMDGTGLSAGKRTDANFIKKVGAEGIEPAGHLSDAHPGLALYEGTIVRTVLDKGINTDLPGSIRAHVTSDVYDSVYGDHLLIPRGSVVIGEYSTGLVVGQDRVLVALSRLILPDGQSVSLMGTPAGDMQGVSGLPADIDNHFMKMFGASLMVGAASMLLPNQQQNITMNLSPSGIQQGGTVFGTTLQQAITSLSKRNLDIQPTGTVDVGVPFTFTLSRDIVMGEYKGRVGQ